jgi:hypothetical protein
MIIPDADNLKVEESKIKDYLLNVLHPDGSGKAAFFIRFGFNVENWLELAQALKKHALTYDVKSSVESQYGIRYIIDGKLETPDNRNPLVRTVWITEKDSNEPRLVTVYPI